MSHELYFGPLINPDAWLQAAPWREWQPCRVIDEHDGCIQVELVEQPEARYTVDKRFVREDSA